MAKRFQFSIKRMFIAPTLLARPSLPFCLAIALLGLVGASAAYGQLSNGQGKASGDSKVVVRSMVTGLSVPFKTYLQERAERQLEEIAEFCKLTDEQKRVLAISFGLDDFLLVKWSEEHVSKVDRPTIDSMRDYRRQLCELDSRIQVSRFKKESLSSKIIQSKLDSQQRELLHEFYLCRFVDRAADDMKLNAAQRELLKQRILESDDRKELAFNANVHLEKFKDIGVSKLLQRTGREFVEPFISFLLRAEFID